MVSLIWHGTPQKWVQYGETILIWPAIDRSMLYKYLNVTGISAFETSWVQQCFSKLLWCMAAACSIRGPQKVEKWRKNKTLLPHKFQAFNMFPKILETSDLTAWGLCKFGFWMFLDWFCHVPQRNHPGTVEPTASSSSKEGCARAETAQCAASTKHEDQDSVRSCQGWGEANPEHPKHENEVGKTRSISAQHRWESHFAVIFWWGRSSRLLQGFQSSQCEPANMRTHRQSSKRQCVGWPPDSQLLPSSETHLNQGD